MTEGLPDIDILGRQQARALLQRAGPKVKHLISISDAKVPPPEEVRNSLGRTLVLQFDDVTDQFPGLTPPSQQNVQAILKFAAPIPPGEYLLCHCNAGISRSSAAALAVIAARLPPSLESAELAITELLKIKTMIFPNSRMVRFTDALLGYEGALVDAHTSRFKSEGLFLG